MIDLGNDWNEIIGGEFEKDYYKSLRAFLKDEYANETVYPSMYDIFNALKATAYSSVKVVILGQDPYHGPSQAHGMSFSVKEGIRKPPSLCNIYREISEELGIQMSESGYLMPWAKQGVLLLNTVLTVRSGRPASHAGHGWEIFTDEVLRKLNEREDPIVFLLWGTPARKKKVLLTSQRHAILEAPHPSPLSAYYGFFGCGHFKKANDYLVSWGKTPIDWQI